MLAKTTPAMDVFDAVSKHVNWQFNTILGRGSKHTVPSANKDIKIYTDTIVREKWFKDKGRTMKTSSNRAKDVMTAGIDALFHAPSGGIKQWWQKRSYTRATSENWNERTENVDLAGGPYPEQEVADNGENVLAADEPGHENFDDGVSEPDNEGAESMDTGGGGTEDVGHVGGTIEIRGSEEDLRMEVDHPWPGGYSSSDEEMYTR